MIILAIPAYNEEDNIGRLFDRILTTWQAPGPYQVILVNDGSTDRTAEVAASYRDRLPLTIVNHSPNQGVGQAFRTAFRTALDLGGPGDTLVMLEADNTSDLGILNDLLARVREGYDLALASCYMPGGGIDGTTWLRLMLSESANMLLRVAFPIGVYTYSSFYRAYRLEALRRATLTYGDMLIEEPGFVCAVEVLVKMSRMNMRIAEVPMVLRSKERQGTSKMNVMRTVNRYLHFIAHHRFQRGTSALPLPARPVDLGEM
ncbi:MAG: glycosyltransferase family 2 protein [Chloroflexales bacterium]|nr:glycosyltransferase family 2 protein [Chloroflexales bacterium]